MTSGLENGGAPAHDPYPAIRVLLARRRAIVNGGAAAAGILAFYAAWRLGAPELYLIGVAAVAALHFVLKVAIEVVGLVAETLMPR